MRGLIEQRKFRTQGHAGALLEDRAIEAQFGDDLNQIGRDAARELTGISDFAFG